MSTELNVTLTGDAHTAVQPTIKEMISDMVAQGLESASGFQLTVNGQVTTITSLNSKELLEKDANGHLVIDPVTEQPKERVYDPAVMTITRVESGKAA